MIFNTVNQSKKKQLDCHYRNYRNRSSMHNTHTMRHLFMKDEGIDRRGSSRKEDNKYGRHSLEISKTGAATFSSALSSITAES